MKSAKYAIAIICFLSVVSAYNCKEVFEKSLDNENVVLSAPVNNLVSDSSLQVFYWQPIDSGINYELQVVSPRFDSIVRLITDTTIRTNVLSISLSSGQYQWRVRAFNSSSATTFSVSRTLTIL